MAPVREHGYRFDVEGDVADVSIQLHVLARAYFEACLALTRRAPAGQHRLEMLGVTIEFEVPETPD
ncbi:MAG TPA: hypothetical protein VI195_10010 [Steroidobacteraceae bacterium]